MQFLKNSIYISISLVFLTPLIPSLFLGYTYSNMFCFFGMSLFVFALMTIYMYLIKDTIDIAFTLPDIVVIIFYIYAAFRNINNIFPFWNEKFTIFTILIVWYFIFKWILKENKQLSYLIFAVILITGLIQIAWGMLQLFGFFPNLDSRFFIGGSFGNPNIYAGYIVIIVPIALWINLNYEYFERYSNLFKNLSLTFFLGSFLVLPATQSRAAWIAGSIGIIVVLNKKYNLIKRLGNILNSFWKKLLFYSITTCIICAISLFLYYLKVDSANGRIFIWHISWEMFKQNPLFGIGYDMYSVEYNNFQREYFAINPYDFKNILVADTNIVAFNELYEILIELGIVGFSLFIFFIVTSCFTNKNETRVISFIGFITILILSQFFYSFHVLSLSFLFIFFISTVSLHNTFLIFSISYKMRKLNGLAIIIFITVASYNYVDFFQDTQKYMAGLRNITINNWITALNQLKSVDNQLNKNNEYYFYLGRAYFKNNEFKNSITAYLESYKKSKKPETLINMAKSYYNLGDFTHAENCLIDAININPSKHYPRYMLIKLYYELGFKNKLINSYCDFLKMPVKINTVALNEMKIDLKKYFKNTDCQCTN